MATARATATTTMAAAASGEPMTAEQAAQEASDRLSAKLPGFDPTVIIGIITAILKALGVCGVAPAEAKRMAEDGGLFPKLRLRLALRSENLSPRETAQVVQAVLDTGSEATDDEMAAFCRCCD